ncbi:MAG TPA: AAA family ATPase [Pyrinomonadaceae bacterium]|nr:AAA family ATPase [Pyrinomonadaceae bacterium]
MYTDFYGLKELPFALTPDPRYLYFTPSHTEVMANLHYGIESGRGLIVVTGEVGTGKTTLLRWMMQRLDRTVMIAYIFNPRLSVTEFYQYLSALFNIGAWENKSDLLLELGKVLEGRHNRGLRTVLVVDEGHGLSTEVLEEIRLLCNFESDTAKHLQIVLTGQPELREVLNQPNLRQLKQRVALRCEISGLPNVEETAHYISSRLKVAGAAKTDIFSPGAVDYIFRCSAGIPRNINNLCDNALLNGFASGATVISRAIIEEVAATFDMLPRNGYSELAGLPPQETAARIFNSSARAELWAAGNGDSAPVTHAQDARTSNGNGNGNSAMGVSPMTHQAGAGDTTGNGHGNGNGYRYGENHVQDARATENFSLVSPAPERDYLSEYLRRTEPLNLSEPPASPGGFSFEEPRSPIYPPANAGGSDRFGRGNNGQSL